MQGDSGISVRPLYPEERTRFLRFVEDPNSIVPGGPFPVDPKRLAIFIYETGWHTDDLVHPERRHAHVAPDGRLVVVRAKKQIGDPDALVVLTPHRRIAPWYREFLAAFPPVRCDRREREPIKVRHLVRGIWVDSADESGRPKVRAHCNCAVPYDRIIYRVCSAAGLPDGAGMRTLRHTFGFRWYEGTRDINVVREKTGCSLSTALRYAKLAGQKRWETFGVDLPDYPDKE